MLNKQQIEMLLEIIKQSPLYPEHIKQGLIQKLEEL